MTFTLPNYGHLLWQTYSAALHSALRQKKVTCIFANIILQQKSSLENKISTQLGKRSQVTLRTAQKHKKLSRKLRYEESIYIRLPEAQLSIYHSGLLQAKSTNQILIFFSPLSSFFHAQQVLTFPCLTLQSTILYFHKLFTTFADIHT